MIIRVYDKDVLYKEFIFPYSSRQVMVKTRHSGLVCAEESDIFLKRAQGFAAYRLYPNIAQMRQIVELYALQEAGYELRWVFGGERRVYIVSDFAQKKVGLKEKSSRFALDIRLEMVGDVSIDSKIKWYSEDFNIDSANFDEFDQYYPRLEKNGSGNDFYTSGSRLFFNNSNTTLYVKEYLTCYTETFNYVELKDVIYNQISGGWEFIAFRLIFNGNSWLAFSCYPGYSGGSPNALLYMLDNLGHRTSLQIHNYAKDIDMMSAKIYKKDTRVWSIAYKVNDDDYTDINTYSYSLGYGEISNQSSFYVASEALIFNIDGVIVDKDMIYRGTC